ncbi:hypothetical protein L1887_14179 [Cichorium endivia]|nr:hypothetical protein L1887_14179 [Cichorium endivia]
MHGVVNVHKIGFGQVNLHETHISIADYMVFKIQTRRLLKLESYYTFAYKLNHQIHYHFANLSKYNHHLSITYINETKN